MKSCTVYYYGFSVCNLSAGPVEQRNQPALGSPLHVTLLSFVAGVLSSATDINLRYSAASALLAEERELLQGSFLEAEAYIEVPPKITFS